MGPEAVLWKYIKQGMGSRWKAQRHEDISPGIPDISYGMDGVQGWIELKVMDNWPTKSTRPMKFPHFTKLQRHWLMTRGAAGHRCFLLAQIRTDFLLLPWLEIELNDTRTQNQLVEVATVWHGAIDFCDLARNLTLPLLGEGHTRLEDRFKLSR